MKLRTVAMTGVLSLAGLGLVGAGAHAIFTSSAVATQTITAGTLSISVAGVNGNSVPSGEACTGTTCTTVLAPMGPFGSTFATGLESVTITNNGSLPATITGFTGANNAPSSTANTAFGSEAYLCVEADTAWDAYASYDPINAEIGVLNTAGTAALSHALPSLTLAANGGTLTLYVDVFAGEALSSNCDGGTAPASLDSSAEGGEAVLSVTFNFSA